MQQIEKYTSHSSETGITKDNQTIPIGNVQERDPWVETFLSYGLQDILVKSTAFVVERQWQHHDTKRNLALALVGEVGELADVVAWKGDSIVLEDVESIRDSIAQELADVIIIIVRLANLFGINLQEKIFQDYNR